MSVGRMSVGRVSGWVVTFLVWAALVWAAPLRASQSGSDPFSDPRLERWAGDFLEGKKDSVLASVERDLATASPHPFSPHIWVSIHLGRGDLESALDRAGGSLRAGLGVAPAVMTASENRDFRAVIEAWRGAAARRITSRPGMPRLRPMRCWTSMPCTRSWR
ncbi:MAG: hypothetical protein HQL59_09200 [Magnetococcales bacterium]|nr:hypothetical protein [Magnetococcales bacterium]